MLNTVKTESGAEIYENDMQLYLDQYIQERGIKDMNRETQSRWNRALKEDCA